MEGSSPLGKMGSICWIHCFSSSCEGSRALGGRFVGESGLSIFLIF